MLHTILLVIAGLTHLASLNSQYRMPLLIMLFLVGLTNDVFAVWLSTFNITLTTLLEMLFHLVERQVHLATLVDAPKCRIAQQTLHCLPCLLEIAIEGLLAVGALSTLSLAIVARFADLLSAAWAIVRFNCQASAIRAGQIYEHLVVTGVEPHQLTLNIVKGLIDLGPGLMG